MYSLLALGLAVTAQAALAPKPVPPPYARASASELSGNTTFEQLLDHNDPSLGTFSQRYWWNAEFWGGEGYPVVLFTPGEISASGYEGYLTNETITGLFAQEINGAVILIEHRYWGDSSPYTVLTAETLQYLTLEQAVADLTYFAKNVDLPFDTNSSSNAQNAPWVLSGGSYSGALSAWTESTSPGTFWAYHASSAPVEAVYNYWQYFVPIQEGMAKNCSTDVGKVVEYLDQVYKDGDVARQQELKEMFGLGELEHYDDFVSALENGPWLWQDNAFYTGYSDFFIFCDYVENAENGGTNPGPAGVGLEKALAGYAKWFKTELLPGYCASYGYWSDEYSIECFDTYNATNPMYSDLSVSNEFDRQWDWFCCNQPLFYWQDGAPEDRPTIVSRLADAAYWQRQCALFFPETNGYTFGSGDGKTAAEVNAWTKGWDNTESTRLIWTNGQYDPWRESGTSSGFRPGGPLQSTAKEPLQVIPGGFHCSDLILDNAWVNEGVAKVVQNEVNQIVEWVEEYYR
ncbi:hypothetical protein ASPZODRAFT_75976 [Penicilliopsis zonata CBS 506.65]|uniref:Uncharacterized protein n=1 Tax=Penicilliopsis zonata CBS 506.65 TaxID=1073090 RepID=A0A1L9S6U3_9EURO|nr:hypothetical protein ASPZODRAFT_75976 [Penicilliopsis zonata CBS 506.65]OJJ42845.1 hypothetical protein ASPZODRAFT_75976 [Penicilliopsis zonata CBS 506.65]